MKSWIRQNRNFLVFLLLFGLFRTAIADWNPIPSGSMRRGGNAGQDAHHQRAGCAL
jgi:hypothetical protein